MMHKKSSIIILVIALTALGSTVLYTLAFKSLIGSSDVEIIKVTAKTFEFTPSHIEIKKGKTVIIELTSLDRLHGFYIPDLDISVDVMPGSPIQVSITPKETGTYRFLCNSFCGSGHEDMHGEIVVTD